MNDYLKSKYDYIDYKYLGKSVVVADNYVSVEILAYLDRLGFPMYDNFVYGYKDLILMVIDKFKMFSDYRDIPSGIKTKCIITSYFAYVNTISCGFVPAGPHFL